MFEEKFFKNKKNYFENACVEYCITQKDLVFSKQIFELVNSKLILDC